MNNFFKKISILLVLLFLSSCIWSVTYSYWIWTPETGRWINPKYAVKDTPKEQFDYAMSYYNVKGYDRAIREFEKLINAFPNSRYAAESQYYIGRSNESMDEYYKAFNAYQTMIDKYPYTDRLDEVIDRQYEIGVIFFEGKRGRFLGMPIVRSEDRAIEIFNKVIQNSPYRENVDKAYFKLGLVYIERKDFLNARESFNNLIENIPESPLVDRAKYKAAYCAYQFSLEPSYDQQATDRAIEEFKEFIQRYPESELAQKAQSEIDELNEKRAKNLFSIAEFYESRRQPKSAVIYYEDIINKYPKTKWASKAMEKITILNKK